MIGTHVKIIDRMHKIAAAKDAAEFRNMGHASARIRKDAQESIERGEDAGPPGQPPHTRVGHLPRAIVFAYSKQDSTAVIGPRESIVGTAGAAHEHGGEFRGQDFDERDFMEPALEKNLPRFAGDWQGSIGE